MDGCPPLTYMSALDTRTCEICLSTINQPLLIINKLAREKISPKKCLPEIECPTLLNLQPFKINVCLCKECVCVCFEWKTIDELKVAEGRETKTICAPTVFVDGA